MTAVVSRLRSARTGLANLGADPGGHVARATRDIDMAIRELSTGSTGSRGLSSVNRSPSRKVSANQGNATAKGTESDARLRRTLVAVQAAGNMLSNGGNGGDPRHLRALGYVRSAAGELTAALNGR